MSIQSFDSSILQYLMTKEGQVSAVCSTSLFYIKRQHVYVVHQSSVQKVQQVIDIFDLENGILMDIIT